MIRRRFAATATALALIPIGIAWRMAPLHLPPFLYKYGGSVLWAAMVYWLVAALLPRLNPVRVAGLAALIAALVECSRLIHTPSLDAFRVTAGGQAGPRAVLFGEGYRRLLAGYFRLRGG